MKSKLDKLEVDKLIPVPVDLCKLGDVVKNDVVKKGVYYAEIETIEDKIPDIANLATNTTLNAKINEVKKEISSITNLTTTATPLNAKINEVKNKIPNITNLATTTTTTTTTTTASTTTTTALNGAENKIPNVSNIVTTSCYNTNTSEIKNKIAINRDDDKYIDTLKFNKLTSESFNVKQKQANLASKNDIADFVKKTDFDNKLKNVTSNKNELNELSKKF